MLERRGTIVIVTRIYQRTQYASNYIDYPIGKNIT